MKMSQNLSQKMRQELTLKPMMLQSLNMLTKTVLEMDVYLKNELINNPMLEVEEEMNEKDEAPDSDNSKEENDTGLESENSESEVSEKDDSVEMAETIAEAEELSEALDFWREANYSGGKNSSSGSDDDFNPMISILMMMNSILLPN